MRYVLVYVSARFIPKQSKITDLLIGEKVIFETNYKNEDFVIQPRQRRHTQLYAASLDVSAPILNAERTRSYFD